MKTLRLQFTLLALLTLHMAYGQSIFINEIHYDNAGADTGEGIELAGPSGSILDGYVIDLYNGSNGEVYKSLQLSGTVPDQLNGFGVLFFEISAIQNGSPDAIALSDAQGNLLQFLSYEGSLVGVGGPADGLQSMDIGISENGGTALGTSLQLTGAGIASADFTWTAQQESFGYVNSEQLFGSASIDCVVSEWSPWSDCSAACDGGLQTRTRTILVQAAFGGVACPVLEESRPCNQQPCLVDTDNDTIIDSEDNCPDAPNTDQSDVDGDGIGDVCDSCNGDDATGDADGDGYCSDIDCDDNAATIYPGAAEVIDGVDNDCDGIVDEDVCAAPSRIHLVRSSETSLEIGWTPSSNAVNHEVRYRRKGALAWTIARVKSSTLFLENIPAGTAIQFRIRTDCSLDGSAWTKWTKKQTFYTEGLNGCFTPQGFFVSNTTDHSTDLSWYPVENAHGYQIRVKHSSSKEWKDYNTSNPGITLEGLLSGSTYRYRIQSVCAEDGSIVSGYSRAHRFTTSGASACDSPTNLSFDHFPEDPTVLRTNWEAAKGAREYQLQWRAKGTSKWSKAFADQTTYVMSDLYSGSVYEVRVRSYCSTNRKIRSPFVTTTVTTSGPVTCEDPVIISAEIGDTEAAFAWSEALGNQSFETRNRIKNGAWNYQTTYNSAITLTGLYSGTAYELELRNNCGPLQTSWVSYEYVTSGAATCPAPKNLTVMNVSSNQADISWLDDGPSTVEYEINYKVKKGSRWTVEYTASSTYMFDNLLSGTAYKVRVRSLCGNGDLASEFSPVTSFTTAGDMSCEIPIDLMSEVLDEQTANLSWAATSSSLMYEIQYRASGDKWKSLLTTQSSFMLMHLSPNDHEWRVRSVCSSDKSIRSNWSARAAFNTITGETSGGKILALVTPNPASDLVTLNFALPQDDRASIRIRKLAGPIVFEVPLRSYAASSWSQVTWNASMMMPGVYIYRITSEKSGKKGGRIEVVK